jgi:hypothetical protein
MPSKAVAMPLHRKLQLPLRLFPIKISVATIPVGVGLVKNGNVVATLELVTDITKIIL